MRHRRLGIFGSALLVSAVLPSPLAAQSEKGPYARIAVLRPHDGKTVDFEAGYIRHLDFHRQARDTWAWYGWTVWAGERQRWFVYATFGHSAASLDNPVPRPKTSGTTSPTSRRTPSSRERALRIPAGPLARHGRAIADRSRRAHDGRARARIRAAPFEAALGCGAIETSGRDPLVSDGRGRHGAALRPAASAAQPVRDPRRKERTSAPGRRQRVDREDDHRDPESAAHDELWPRAIV